MAKRYRCTNCGTDFVADKPACAKCDIDATTDPQATGIIHPLVTIHYDPPHAKIKGRGLGHRACAPTTHIGRGRGTGEASVVNCEACKATVAYRDAVAKGALSVSIADGEDEIVAPVHAASDGGGVKTEGDCGCK